MPGAWEVSPGSSTDCPVDLMPGHPGMGAHTRPCWNVPAQQAALSVLRARTHTPWPGWTGSEEEEPGQEART